MSEKQTETFETKLTRLEEIVLSLEASKVSLDDSVALFREGKKLANECEQLLKDAETAIEQLHATETS